MKGRVFTALPFLIRNRFLPVHSAIDVSDVTGHGPGAGCADLDSQSVGYVPGPDYCWDRRPKHGNRHRTSPTIIDRGEIALIGG
jgi:hypothetical protein